MAGVRKPRDLRLLDAIDGFGRERFRQVVWRVTRGGRDPLLAAASVSRWCDGSFDVLYTSCERNGALSEVYAVLQSQPVFPSKVNWFIHRLTVACERALRLDAAQLEALGVSPVAFRGRDYTRCQQISDAAHFLDFDALMVPSARWSCSNLIVFTDKRKPEDLTVEESEDLPIDWSAWRAANSK